MTPQQIVGLGLRLLAVWMAVNALELLARNATAFHLTGLDDKAFITVLFAAWWCLMAGILWFFPLSIAHRLVPRTRFENHLDIHALDAVRAGCCLMGLWIFVHHLENFLWLIFRGALTPGNESVIRSLSDQEKFQLFFVCLQLGIALFMMLGSARFATWALGRRDHGITSAATDGAAQ